MSIMEFYFRSESGTELVFNEQDFEDGVKQLVWYNKGMYGIVSEEKIQNIIAYLEDFDNLPKLSVAAAKSMIFWDEMKIIPPEIASLLFTTTS